jgi:hypothetical protein
MEGKSFCYDGIGSDSRWPNIEEASKVGDDDQASNSLSNDFLRGAKPYRVASIRRMPSLTWCSLCSRTSSSSCD